MPKISTLSAQIVLMTILTMGAAGAQTSSNALEQRLKSSLNAMVQDVREAGEPAEKRIVLDRFLDKITRGANLVEKLPFLSRENHAALNMLQERFDRYSAEFYGGSGSGALQGDGTAASGGSDAAGVADGDLDAFASFMQNDLEQAAGEGVYLSTGAIIIVLLIVLILL